jgi:glutamine amidotransferase
MITIIDYGLGNIEAFFNIYKRYNIEVSIARDKDQLSRADKLILPGVGAFDHAMMSLNRSGMRDTLDKLVLDKKIPVIGICVGMQMMAKRSEEGSELGLGWFDAEVIKFKMKNLLIPEMGWNSIFFGSNPIFNELTPNARFYFLHSYYFQCSNDQDVIAESDYGIRYSSAVNKENIWGIQFHPEKSHSNGIQLLKNFANL